MNWNHLKEEKCPKCSAELNYINQIEQYVCPDCPYSVYLKTFKRLYKWNKAGRTFKYETPVENATTQFSYYEAKNGEPMSDYQKVTG